MASIFAKFFGRTVSEGAAFAAGVATGPALAPVVQEVINRTWEAHPDKRLDAGTAAAVVAEDVEIRDWGAGEAAAHGIDGTRFDALLGEALNAPGIPQLFEAWRRDLIDDAAFEHGLRKAKLEPRWDAPLKGLKERLLSLSDLANARQQGFVDDARQRSESALQGLDGERADILFELSGLPLGVETMQQALNRGLVSQAEFDQAIREGHTKTKYTALAEALRHPVLSADEYATLHLKGWIDQAEMNAGGALHGFTAAQMNLKYLEKGRPAAPGQLWTAAARGIDGQAGRPMDRPQFLEAIKQSDIRPEYGPMLWDIRYLYPSLFQLTRLVTSGAISADIGEDWAHKARYAPEVVSALKESWTTGGTAKADAHVTKAQTHLWTTLHRSYASGESDDAAAQDKMTTLGIPADAQTQILHLWAEERELIRKQLTPAQVKKAWQKVVTNPATGSAWTRDEAVAELLQRGYSMADASTFLDE